MSTTTASQDQIDRANEWANENSPDLTDDEHDAAFAAALADIVAIDAKHDRETRRLAGCP